MDWLCDFLLILLPHKVFWVVIAFLLILFFVLVIAYSPES